MRISVFLECMACIYKSMSHKYLKLWLNHRLKSGYTEKYLMKSSTFGYPRSDTCEKCDLLNIAIQNASDEQRDEHQKELVEHQEKASQGYSSLKKDADATKHATNY